MKIRPLEPGDVETLVDDLWFPLAREMGDLDEFNRVADDVREDAIGYHERALTDEERILLVAVEDGEFVGFVYAKRERAMPTFQRTYDLHVIEVYVREASRQQGIASELLAAVESWENARECEWASLVVHVDNHAAQSLYEDHGFDVKRKFFAKRLE
ncbi:GNAT family N-acetyltransferase [Natronobacterium texcoconense]|uniref:Ribosomal protein S18 acetylase RimI n=1 Tax=Natronobacterium texcoconense TaxID=1095778 RepID=A0A1H1HW74_NATTX|nr:GNAT family N-acetyltransferase [Natronobacterium texcoconense]SDR29732.1 Ribosomal protein S18 acetylase RimI [Natronobacterium texcoconense]